MKVKATIIEMIMDNYQGSSGLPIQRSILIELPNETQLCSINQEVIHALSAQGIQGTYNSNEKIFPYQNILSIELLPVFPST